MVVKKAFTLIELLIVIMIIGLLAVNIIPRMNKSREQAHRAAVTSDIRSLLGALELYLGDHGGLYPPDASRDIPVGLEQYIKGDFKPPRPGSVYDRDNIISPGHPPYEQYIQLSVRFCPIGGPLSACKFPKADRASGFDINSSAYRCIQGPCRSHTNNEIDYPGYCLNCED